MTSGVMLPLVLAAAMPTTTSLPRAMARETSMIRTIMAVGIQSRLDKRRSFPY